jgi:hypothetical protein
MKLVGIAEKVDRKPEGVSLTLLNEGANGEEGFLMRTSCASCAAIKMSRLT